MVSTYTALSSVYWSTRVSVKIFELRAKLTVFSLVEWHFFLREWLTNHGYSDLGIWQTLSEMNKVSLSLQGKQLTVFVAHNKNRAIQQKLEFWKMCMCLCELDSFPILNSFFFFFLWDWNDINECDLLILYYKMYQHLENLYNSVKQHFPNDQCMLQSQTWEKNPFKVQNVC